MLIVEIFDESGFRKFWGVKNDTCQCVHFIVIFYLLYVCIYSYVERKILICTNMHMHCIKCKCKLTTPFWVVTGYMQARRRVLDITSQHMYWLVSMCAGIMKRSFTTNSVIWGYHVYKDGRDAPIEEVLYCEWEIRNRSKPCTVTVKRATLRATGGHVPCFMSPIFSIFLCWVGVIR